jgi:putative tryptophan/tyrosine transport system substrate-binding protein
VDRPEKGERPAAHRFRTFQAHPKDRLTLALAGWKMRQTDQAGAAAGRYDSGGTWGGSRMLDLRRRDFVTLLSGAAVAWPLAARAQQSPRMRRIGVLNAQPSDDPQSQARNGAFLQGLGALGWNVGRNLEIDYRWGAGRSPGYAADLVALAPEVILAVGSSVVVPLLQVSRTVPVVFTQVSDPVGSGFVASLARPGGNATGFTLFEFGISAKWIELLKEIAPRVTRAAVLLDPNAPTGFGMLGAIQSVAPSLKVEISPINVRDAAESERAVTAFVRGADDGLIVLPGLQTVTHRQLFVTLAARHKLPTVYPYRYVISGGGLISYGPDELEQYRQAAGYIDRILKGEKPADLPVQAATKFELVIKALGLEVPPTLLARADEVIE